MMAWRWFGITTHSPTCTPANRFATSSHQVLTMRPAAFAINAPSSMSPKRHLRPWTQMVTKYAPGVL
jgi:hypothetical protein